MKTATFDEKLKLYWCLGMAPAEAHKEITRDFFYVSVEVISKIFAQWDANAARVHVPGVEL